MSTYNLNTLVSNSEQEALKEMIFKRARERAQALVDESQSSYTTAIQNDIMNIARDSFSASKNPFSIKEEKQEEVKTNEDSNSEIERTKTQVESLKNSLYRSGNSIKKNIQADLINSSMLEARGNINNKKTFVGALDFLNKQATIVLVNKNKQSFEALA